MRPVILFDLRRLVVASAAAVEDQDHEAASDHKGEEDAKPHHQPAPRRHCDIAGRDPSLMADIDRSSQEREKNTDNDKTQGTAPRPGHCSGQNPMDHLVPAPEMLLLVWSPCLEIDPRRAPQARPECRKGNPKAAIGKKQLVDRLPSFG